MATDISFDDLIPTKQRGSSTPSKGTNISFDDLIPSKASSSKEANISFDDLIPKEPEARLSTTPIIEGEGGAAFGMYSKPGLQSGSTSDAASRLGRNIYRTGGEAIVPTGAGLAGFGAGMAVAAPYAASAAAATAATGIGAPFAPIVGGAVVLGGGFGGAMVASGAAKKVQDLMHKTFAPEDYAQRQIEKEAYPTSTFLTELGVGMAGMSPRTAVSAVSEGASRAARFVASPIGQRTVSGGLQGGIEAGTEFAETGTIEPLKVAAATAAGAAMPGFNIAGRIPFVAGQKIGEKISSVLPGGVKPVTPIISDLPPKPPEGSPPEEVDAYITKLEAIKAERDAKAPIVEAAIRNKKTGGVTKLGPKHPEDLKKELGLMPIDKNTLEEAVAPWSDLPQEQQDLIRRYVELTHEISAAQKSSDPKTWTLEEKAAYERGDTAEFSRLRGYSKEDITKYKEWQKTTDDVIKLLGEDEAFGISYFLNQKHTYSHEAGFIDKRGNFLTRQEAVDRAKNTGQLPKDYVPEVPEVGLRSDDLRKAGDKRFEITDDLTQKPFDPNELISRQDFKTAIDDKEFRQGVSLEIDMVEAQRRGDTKALEELKAEDARLTAELEQLRRDIPAVKFADINKPTWVELHDHLWGTKSVGEALERIIQTPSLGTVSQRILAKALNKSSFINSARLEFSNNLLKYVDKNGFEKQDATGLYTGGDRHLVELGEGGNVRTLLHEAIHAGTQRLLNEKGSAAAIKMQELFDKYKLEQDKKYDEALKKELQEKGSLSPAEYDALDKKFKLYGFEDVHEFTAEAFTSKQFQELLSGISVGQQPKGVLNNLWGAFKETVRISNGIPEGARTAFDEVMDSGISMIKQSEQFTPRADFATSAPSKAMSSPDELPVDKTKTDPRDVKSEEEFYDIAAEIFAKHGKVAAVEFYEGYKEYKRTWLEPIKEIEKFIGTNLNQKQASELFAHNKAAELKEMAGKDVNLEQLTYDIDKGVTLTGKAKEVATKFRTLMDELGKLALEKGVIKGWHENYVARNVVSEGNAPKGALEEFMRDVFGYGEKASGEGTKTTTKYGQERKLKSREDLVSHINGINEWLEAKGLDYRFKLKTDNLADIYKDYALSVEKAIENKNLVDNIKQLRNDNGESLIKKIDNDNPLPYQWEQIDHPDLAGYAVHPDLVPHLKFVFDAGPGVLMSALGNISQWTKFFNVIGSFFHAKSLMEVLSSAKIPIWTPLKEAIVLPLVEKGVKAVTGKELQLSAITKALDQFRKAGVGGNVDMWIKSELTLEMPEDVTRGILTSLGKFSDRMIGKFGPKTRVLESSLSFVEKNTLGLFNKYTWDYLHTGGKLFVADAYLNKARMQAAKDGKPFDEMAVRKEISRFVNESFGGLNWYDIVRQTEGEFAKRMALAAYSPAGRRGLQVLLFAPDWTISTLRAFTAALPKELNPTKWQPVEGIKGMMTPTTKADYARLYQFKTALTMLTLYNAINIITADRPIWENKDPTRIEYPDGTSMQAAKHAMEPYHWIMDPVKTLSNKLGFIPKAAIITIAGTEYASPDAPKLVDRSILGRLKAAGSGALPFQAQAAMNAPEGEGAKRALLGTLGFPVYGGTPEQKKAARAEREKLLKKQAQEYREKAKLRGWEK